MQLHKRALNKSCLVKWGNSNTPSNEPIWQSKQGESDLFTVPDFEKSTQLNTTATSMMRLLSSSVS